MALTVRRAGSRTNDMINANMTAPMTGPM